MFGRGAQYVNFGPSKRRSRHCAQCRQVHTRERRWRIVIQMVLENALRESIVENSKDPLKRLVVESPSVYANVRWKFLISSSSARFCGESYGTGGPGRSWLPGSEHHVLHVPASGSSGVAPTPESRSCRRRTGPYRWLPSF